MKGREGKGPPSTDLLVCFPSRARLTLMPKPICSPARPSESSKRQYNQQHHHHASHHHHHLKKSSYRSGGAGQASPLLWAKTKPMSKDISEPTSPKVTCAGQIKVRHKPTSSCKNWQSVMEEIERLHNNRKHKKRSAWIETLGFKKDVMQFLTCLRNIRFDFRCFGAFPTSEITSDDDDDEEDEDCQENHKGREASDDNESNSRTVFSKWFMVLQESNNNKDIIKKDKKEKKRSCKEESIEEAPCAPPPNALLLMRCRSAPAKSWLEVKEEDDEEENHDDEDDEKQREEDEKKAKLAMEEEKKKNENLVVMRYGTDFYKFSSDIAKETWVVGGIRDPLTRSRSWKR